MSLKEGMFNSANVIFRTRFVDGVSAVTRTVVGGRDKARIADASTGSKASSSSSLASASASASASAASEASSDQDLGEAKAPASKKGKKRTSSRSGAARSAGVENMVEA